MMDNYEFIIIFLKVTNSISIPSFLFAKDQHLPHASKSKYTAIILGELIPFKST